MSNKSFTENKYSRVYFQIVERSKNREINEYCELHHIIPRSLEGSNDPSNLVKLTAREHFLCHWLLTKMTTGIARQKMCYAFKLMSIHGKSTKLIEISKRTPARLSAETKKKISTTAKIQYMNGRNRIKGMLGKNLSTEQKEKIRIALTNKPKTEEHKQKLRKPKNIDLIRIEENKQRLKGKTWKVVDGKRVWFERNNYVG